MSTTATATLTDREGWSRTRGWSKRVHYFQEERSLCSGATPADGPLHDSADQVEGDPCQDCLARGPSRQTGKIGARKGKARV